MPRFRTPLRELTRRVASPSPGRRGFIRRRAQSADSAAAADDTTSKDGPNATGDTTSNGHVFQVQVLAVSNSGGDKRSKSRGRRRTRKTTTDMGTVKTGGSENNGNSQNNDGEEPISPKLARVPLRRLFMRCSNSRPRVEDISKIESNPTDEEDEVNVLPQPAPLSPVITAESQDDQLKKGREKKLKGILRDPTPSPGRVRQSYSNNGQPQSFRQYHVRTSSTGNETARSMFHAVPTEHRRVLADETSDETSSSDEPKPPESHRNPSRPRTPFPELEGEPAYQTPEKDQKKAGGVRFRADAIANKVNKSRSALQRQTTSKYHEERRKERQLRRQLRAMENANNKSDENRQVLNLSEFGETCLELFCPCLTASPDKSTTADDARSESSSIISDDTLKTKAEDEESSQDTSSRTINSTDAASGGNKNYLSSMVAKVG